MAKKETFEEKLNRLESIVESLEAGDVELEAALKQFEEGVKVYRDCLKWLDKADQTIAKINEDGQKEPFDTDED